MRELLVGRLLRQIEIRPEALERTVVGRLDGRRRVVATHPGAHRGRLCGLDQRLDLACPRASPRTPHTRSRAPLRRLASASARSASARPRRSLGEGGPFAWLARDARSRRGLPRYPPSRGARRRDLVKSSEFRGYSGASMNDSFRLIPSIEQTPPAACVPSARSSVRPCCGDRRDPRRGASHP